MTPDATDARIFRLCATLLVILALIGFMSGVVLADIDLTICGGAFGVGAGLLDVLGKRIKRKAS